MSLKIMSSSEPQDHFLGGGRHTGEKGEITKEGG